MDFRQLEMFQAIVETGSFTRAGQKLYVSQSAISRKIKLLEEELGEQVFKRMHKKIYLTSTGEILLRYTRKVFSELVIMKGELSNMTNLLRGSLRLAGGMSVCTYLFPTLVKEYQKLYPSIDLTIATGTNKEILRMLRSNQLDLALLSLPLKDKDLEVREALVEEMVLVMEREHPLSLLRAIDFKDLIPYTYIHFEKEANTRRLLDKIFQREGVHFSRSMELQNVEITKPLVEIGLGVSIIPYPAVKNSTGDALCWRRIGKKPIFRALGWVFLKSDYTSRVVLKLLDLFEVMKEQFTPTTEFPKHSP